MPRLARVAFLAVAAAVPWVSPAATLTVPGQYATIQAAINAASNGDVVQVAAGTYFERLAFSSKATITVQGAGAGSTTINGGSAGTTVTFTGNSSTIAGFTITGGMNAQYDGGGVLVNGGSPTISNNVIAGNVAGNGAGIALRNGAAIVQGNVIRDNQESCGSGCSGGGIQVGFGSTTPQITGNLIQGNSSEEGAGIEVTSGNPLIQGNVIRANVGRGIPGGSIGGEGLFIRWASARVVDNLVAENAGGGISVTTLSSEVVSIVNDTVAMNGGSNGSAFLANASGGTIRVVNSILAGNGTAVACSGSAPAAVAFQNSDLFAYAGTSQSGCTVAAGNLAADPLFVDLTNGNYRLRPTSPAIDAGTLTMPSGVVLPAVDLDGYPRVVNGKVDLGAWEYQGVLPVTVSALSLAFGTQRVGTSSAPQTITVTNGGTTGLQVSGVSVTGEYSLTTTCRGPNGIAPGASCTISVTFQPATRFARTDTLTLLGNVGQVNGVPATPSGPVALTVSLTGTGIAPHVVLSGATLGIGPSLAFGQQRVGTTSASQTVTVTNDGEVALTVASVTAPAPFLAVPTGCTSVAANGGTCTVALAFAPVSRGAFAGTLTIASDAINAPSTVALGGQGIAPVVSLSPTSVAFAAQRVGDATSSPVTLSNTGDDVLHIASIAAQGVGFSQTNACPALAPGASCTVQAQFAPTSSGAKTGTITVGSDAVNAPNAVALSGQAVDFTLAMLPGSYPVAQGQAASFTLFTTASGNVAFTWPVALACSGAPAGAICTFTPSAAVTPGWQAQVTVGVAPALAASPLPRAGTALALLALPLLGLAARRRGAFWAAMLAIALAAAGGMACGGSSPGGGGGMAKGTYTITVTGTSGTLTHVATAQLQVM